MRCWIVRAGLVSIALLPPTLLVAPALAGAPAQLSGAADGALELRDGAKVLAHVPLKTPALRRGAPSLREVEIDGHRVAELRVPVRGTAAQEVWVGELGAATPRVIWSGFTGPRDADEEASTWLDVTADRILEYQTAAQVTRCDGMPPRLFPRAYDFEGGRFRPVLSPLPPPAAQKLVARRGDPALPAGRPLGGFHWVAASTTASAGSEARALSAPVALDDGDPATAWSEGLGGDGRGEFLTARPTGGGGYAIRGLRVFPGDGASEQAFRAKNRVRRFLLALGPAPDQRFDVELAEDPASDAAHWRQPYWVALPKPMVSSCVTVVLTDVARGTEAAPPKSFGTTAIGDLAIFTELDGPEGAERLVADVAKAADCASRVQMVVSLGEAAVLPAAQAVMTTKGAPRECLVEALTTLQPAPKSPIVAEALVAAVTGASDKEERLIAAALRRAPAPPVTPLQQMLDGAKVPIDDRMRAARVLGSLPDERAADALLTAVGHGPEALRASVVQALAGSAALRPDLLLAALNQGAAEGDARQGDLLRVLPALVKRAPEQRAAALATLHAALAPERPFVVRGRAVMALGALGGSDAARELTAVRADSDEPVLRYLAARELGEPGGPGAPGTPAAAPALRAALADRDPRVRETAAQGLGQIRDSAAGAALIEGAKQEPWPFVRRAQLEALGHLCVPGTGDLMIRANERDVDEVRRAALVTLVRCKDPRGKTILLRTLGRRNEAATLRELAAALLGEVGDRSAAPDLATILKRLVNESEADIALEGVAASTLRTLSHLGGPQAVGSAVTLAKDTRHPFRYTAIEALGTLCDPGPGAATLRSIVTGSDASLAVAAQHAEKHCAQR